MHFTLHTSLFTFHFVLSDQTKADILPTTKEDIIPMQASGQDAHPWKIHSTIEAGSDKLCEFYHSLTSS